MQIAHDKGVIHRDLKPANVLLGEDGSPKITDFGLAKKLDEAGQTASGAVMGTPSYMAPEQAGYKPEAQARSIGPAADVYALGAILYECLTGRPPFKAATPLDTILLVVSVEPAAPSLLAPQVPRNLETICLKCLQKEPAKRYASALALADDLHRFLAGEPIVARPVGRAERAWKWARRRPAAAALLAVSVLAALALLGTISIAAALIYGKNHDLIEQRDRANKEAEKARIAGEEAHAEAKKAQRRGTSPGEGKGGAGPGGEGREQAARWSAAPYWAQLESATRPGREASAGGGSGPRCPLASALRATRTGNVRNGRTPRSPDRSPD